MFQPLGYLFSHQPAQWEEVDVKYLIQDWLRGQLKSEAVYCDDVKKGVAHVRVASPALQQAVRLSEYDLVQYVCDRSSYELNKMTVKVEG